MKTRLTLLIDSLAPGGAQTQIVQLAASLDPDLWQVRLHWYNDTRRFREVPDGVRSSLLARRNLADPKFYLQMARLVSRRESDLVHAWLPSPSLYGTLAGLLPGSAPVVTAVRSSPSLFARDPTQRRLTLWTTQLASATTCNSSASLKWLVEQGIAPSRLHYIGNALPPSIANRTPSTADQRGDLLQRLGLDPLRPPIVSLGRFDAYKNQDGLVRALAMVRDRRQNPVPPLLLAGFLEDEQRVERVRQLAKDLRLEVHIVPAVTDVATLLEAGRFSVLASRSEGTPNVVLEAMGLGTLVVATRVGEVPELARDGETALLCAPEDDAALADALERALDLPTEPSQRLCSQARQDIVERFADRVIAARYETVFRSVLPPK